MTVFYLSITGTLLILFLFIFKPVLHKKVPVRWQYFLCVLTVLMLLAPIWKLIPPHTLASVYYRTDPSGKTMSFDKIVPAKYPLDFLLPSKEFPFPISDHIKEDFHNIWFYGMIVFLMISFANYWIFIIKEYLNSTALTNLALLNEVKANLKIRRHIFVRISSTHRSPMLVGIFFPTIYLPSDKINDNTLRLILLHELTHYRHKDLLHKWGLLFLNAIHWFNPFMYWLRNDMNQLCEMICDCSVTRNFTINEKKSYMNMILEFACKNHSTIWATYMSSHYKNLKHRFQKIYNNKVSFLTLAITILFFAMLIVTPLFVAGLYNYITPPDYLIEPPLMVDSSKTPCLSIVYTK